MVTIELPPDWVALLAAEFQRSVLDARVWTGFAVALSIGVVLLGFGAWAATQLDFLDPDAPPEEVLGVGLSTGLLLSALGIAAVWSAGRSSLTPPAIAISIAIAVAAVRGRSPMPRFSIRAAVAAAAFIAGVALLYGATMAPAPRDGTVAIVNPDVAFYSVLARDLAATGVEINNAASGFVALPGAPDQVWYHWGEIWLAAAVLSVLDLDPLSARHFVVLPLVLLAASAMAGTITQKLTRRRSTLAYLFGFCVYLVLAPFPLIADGPFFSDWAFGMGAGVAQYGLAAGTVLLVFHVALRPAPRLSHSVGFGGLVAALVPLHLAIAAMTFVAAVAAAAANSHRRDEVRRAAIAILLVVATVGWGIVTGHALGGSSPADESSIAPFNRDWAASVVIVLAGSGMLVLVPIAWGLTRFSDPRAARTYAGATGAVVVGAIAWGWRLADLNAFYLFFAPLAVLAVPVAPAAAIAVIDALRERGWTFVAAIVSLGCAAQLTWGAFGNTVPALVRSGPLPEQDRVPQAVLRAIEALPPNARIAYQCRQFEEATFAQPQLLSIDAYTGRRMIPLCFQADVTSHLVGGTLSPDVPGAAFALAPQRVLFPTATSKPSEAEVRAFLQDHGIAYWYVDTYHANELLPGAVPIFMDGPVQLLRAN